MTASSMAMGAGDDMGKVVAAARQMKLMIAQIGSVRMQGKEEVNNTRGKLAAAAQIASGGTGTGQMLQVRAGQSTVKLDELAKVLGHAADMCEGIALHGSAVENEIRQWAATLRS